MLPVVDVGPRIDSLTRFFQLVCRDTSGELTLGSPPTVVLLDQAY